MKSIAGFEGYYICKNGNVYSDKSGKLKKRKIIYSGEYPFVQLRNNSRYHTKYIHRLLAEAYISNPGDMAYVNHKNGDKHDFSISNLEWVSPSENSLHAYKNGLSSKKGVKHHLVKLSLNNVIEIKKRIKNGESCIKIAEDYPVGYQAIYKIKHRERWAHVEIEKEEE